MIHDFNNNSYRKLLGAVLSREGMETRSGRLSLGGLTAIGSDDVEAFTLDRLVNEKIHCFGVETSEDIRNFEEKIRAVMVDEIELTKIIYIVRITKENLYDFSTCSLDDRAFIFILEEAPSSIEIRLHLFSLFHKLMLQRRVIPLAYYYSQLLAKISSGESNLDSMPDITKCLEAGCFKSFLTFFCERLCAKFDLYNLLSRLRARAYLGKMEPKEPKNCRHVLITGWYGTETSGDKAILMELVDVLQEKCPGIRISITSIVPGWSRLTNLELDLNAEVVELRSLNYRNLENVDLVVIGGGPLMDSSQLKYIDTLFGWAHSSGITTMIFGCGVGPLKTEFGRSRVISIIKKSDYAFFRDEKSAELAKDLGLRVPALNACDPAMRYITRWAKERAESPEAHCDETLLVALLREQTKEYSDSASEVSSHLLKEFRRLFQMIVDTNASSIVRLLPMHTFWLGNDDREYLAKFVEGFSSDKFTTCSDALSLERLLREISSAKMGLPMRYHGHVFMLALGIPFVSVDYTGESGKIGNLLERYDLLEYSVPSDRHLDSAKLLLLWNRISDLREEIQSKIRFQRDQDLRDLEHIYSGFWG